MKMMYHVIIMYNNIWNVNVSVKSSLPVGIDTGKLQL